MAKDTITLIATQIVSDFFQKGSLQSCYYPQAQINSHLTLLRHLSDVYFIFRGNVNVIIIATQIVMVFFSKRVAYKQVTSLRHK